MKALSIRQPWAWLILHAGKDIENRDWRTSFRGQFIIHASASVTKADYFACEIFLRGIPGLDRIVERMPAIADLPRGGIVGRATMIDCLVKSSSPWFCGFYGFKLADPCPLPFLPYRGSLGFFNIPETALPNGYLHDQITV